MNEKGNYQKRERKSKYGHLKTTWIVKSQCIGNILPTCHQIIFASIVRVKRRCSIAPKDRPIALGMAYQLVASPLSTEYKGARHARTGDGETMRRHVVLGSCPCRLLSDENILCCMITITTLMDDEYSDILASSHISGISSSRH